MLNTKGNARMFPIVTSDFKVSDLMSGCLSSDDLEGTNLQSLRLTLLRPPSRFSKVDSLDLCSSSMKRGIWLTISV